MSDLDIGLVGHLFFFLAFIALAFNGFLMVGKLYDICLFSLATGKYIRFVIAFWLGLFFLIGAIGITIFAFGNAIVHIYKLTGTDLTLLSDPLKWALRLGM